MNSIARLTVAISLLGSTAALGCGGERPGSPPSVDIVAEDYEFTAPDTVRSGWTTLRLHNQGSEDHLFTFIRLPDGVTYEDFEREALAPLDSVWSLVLDGTIEESAFGETVDPLLPDWYSDLIQPGGVSLTAPGRTAQTTVRLEPGVHVLECYVLTSEEEYHLLEGMAHRVEVVPPSNGAEPPTADHDLELSDLDLTGVRDLSPGEHTFAFHFLEDPEGLPWQHVHLARLDENTDVQALAEWMKVDPVMPSPVEFLGGPQHMPAGNTAYATFKLKPGHYAWGVGEPPEQGEVETFSVE